MSQIQSWGNASDGLRRVREAAKRDKRLDDLHGCVHQGTYRALPLKRTSIPKPDGRGRHLGVAALATCTSGSERNLIRF
jgi:hypothetical protein